MKLSKLLKLISLICVCTIIMTGCFPTAEIYSGTEKNNYIPSVKPMSDSGGSGDRISKHITDNYVETLNIDADVVVPKEFDLRSNISSALVRYKKWDGEKIVSELIKNDLIGGKSIVKIESGENSGPNDLFYSYDLDDESFVSTSTGNICFKTPKYITYQYSAFFDDPKNYIFDDSLKNIFGSEDIAIIDKQQSIEQSEKIISMLDMDPLVGEPEIYSMTAEKMQDIINDNPMHYKDENEDGEPDEKRVFTEDESAYIIIYPIMYNGIGSSGLSNFGENEILDCSKAFFVYTRSGLIGFDILGIFEENNVIQSGVLLPPESACDSLKGFYNDLILESSVNISLLKLVFINRHDIYAEDFTEYKIEPVWLVYGSSMVSKGDSEFKSNHIYYVSALNGEIIA